MREIVHLQVGQYGNHIGSKFWEVISDEHGINETGACGLGVRGCLSVGVGRHSGGGGVGTVGRLARVGLAQLTDWLTGYDEQATTWGTTTCSCSASMSTSTSRSRSATCRGECIHTLSLFMASSNNKPPLASFVQPLSRDRSAVLVDMEAATIDHLRSGASGKLFKPDNILTGATGAGNNWAKGAGWR